MGSARTSGPSPRTLWEGIFYLVAALIITIMGLALLRINKTKQKWKVKIAKALAEKSKKHNTTSWLGDLSRRYVMFLLPFITTLREGVEAVVFVGGVSLSLPAVAFPIPVITGILAGLTCGYLIYRGGNAVKIQFFLIASTCVLYLIAAGMFSKAVWSLQFHMFAQKVGADVAEQGDGPGSYNIKETVWHVNCCNPGVDHGWDIFQAILGWQNTGTYGSVISYNMYWLGIMAAISCMLYEERTGSLPFKDKIVGVLLKVPVLKIYVQKKLDAHHGDADEIIRQIQDDARNQKSIFHQTTNEITETAK